MGEPHHDRKRAAAAAPSQPDAPLLVHLVAAVLDHKDLVPGARVVSDADQVTCPKCLAWYGDREEAAKRAASPKAAQRVPAAKKKRAPAPPEDPGAVRRRTLADLEARLEAGLGLRVSVQCDGKAGWFDIPFGTLDDMDRVIQRLDPPPAQGPKFSALKSAQIDSETWRGRCEQARRKLEAVTRERDELRTTLDKRLLKAEALTAQERDRADALQRRIDVFTGPGSLMAERDGALVQKALAEQRAEGLAYSLSAREAELSAALRTAEAWEHVVGHQAREREAERAPFRQQLLGVLAQRAAGAGRRPFSLLLTGLAEAENNTDPVTESQDCNGLPILLPQRDRSPGTAAGRGAEGLPGTGACRPPVSAPAPAGPAKPVKKKKPPQAGLPEVTPRRSPCPVCGGGQGQVHACCPGQKLADGSRRPCPNRARATTSAEVRARFGARFDSGAWRANPNCTSCRTYSHGSSKQEKRA